MQLEEKSELKKRVGRSPDMADALALTFAEPVREDSASGAGGRGKPCLEELFGQADGKNEKW